MSRNIVALTALALTSVALIVPDPSFARGGGIRGGFHGLRAPAIIARHPRANLPRPFLPNTFQFRHPVVSQPMRGLARTTVRAPFVRLARRHHGAFLSSWIYPTTTDDDSTYIGMPYDPGTAIPVYGPAPAAEQADPPSALPVPRLSNMRDENQEACRSERVTVPATEGEREITVVRC